MNYQQDCRELAHVRTQPAPPAAAAARRWRRCSAALPPAPVARGPAGRVTCPCHARPSPTSVLRRPCLQEYLSAIKGVGVYRANSGPHDEPRWEAYGAGKPSQ